jgi:hypothetical protein
MPEASVALKESPGELIFDPTAFPNLTVRVVPAGTTTGWGAGAGVGAAAGAVAVVGAAPGACVGAAGVAEEFIALPLSVFDGAVFDGAVFDGAVFDGAVFDGAAVSLAELDAVLEAVSAGLCEQATSVNRRKMESTHSPRERIIFSSE